MKLLVLVVVASMGCGSKGDASGAGAKDDPKPGAAAPADDVKEAAGPDGNKMLDELEALKDRMCACTSVECAKEVDRAASDWLLVVDHVSVSVDPKYASRFMRIDRALAACRK